MANELIQKIKASPDKISFDEVIGHIANHYHYTATRFSNGVGDDQLINEAGTNEGSCKIFAFAKLNGLTEAATLDCFGGYYRDDVLGNPDGVDHGNIRTFMRHGWDGIRFDNAALAPK